MVFVVVCGVSVVPAQINYLVRFRFAEGSSTAGGGHAVPVRRAPLYRYRRQALKAVLRSAIKAAAAAAGRSYANIFIAIIQRPERDGGGRVGAARSVRNASLIALGRFTPVCRPAIPSLPRHFFLPVAESSLVCPAAGGGGSGAPRRLLRRLERETGAASVVLDVVVGVIAVEIARSTALALPSPLDLIK